MLDIDKEGSTGNQNSFDPSSSLGTIFDHFKEHPSIVIIAIYEFPSHC